jgi:hypothetical protein
MYAESMLVTTNLLPAPAAARRACWCTASPGWYSGRHLAARHHGRDLHQQGRARDARAHRADGRRPTRGMWVGTFHGLAHRFLRAHWRDANLPQNFQILDSDDQLRVIKRVYSAAPASTRRAWPPKQAQWFINAQKDEGRRPQHIEDYGDHYLQHDAGRSTAPTRRPASAAAWSISPNCCCARTSCG